MNVKSVVKLFFVFSAGFLGASLLVTVGLIRGDLSPRAFGMCLALVCLGGVAFFTVAVQRLARKNAVQCLEAGTAKLSEASRRRQLLLIKVYQAWIVVLVLCLVGGVVKGTSVRPIPFFPMLAGITMNLLITWVLVLTIRKLQKRLS